MKSQWILAASLATVVGLVGCETAPPPGVEGGPHGTIAYDVLIDATAPGARIEVNGQDVGPTPAHIKVFGDKDGTFHDFGSYYYVVRALPLVTNQFAQTRVFMTGHLLTPEDRIPQRIDFDMNQMTPAVPPYASYGPPDYYGPPPSYYGGPGFYGPGVRFYFGPGPGFYHHRHW